VEHVPVALSSPLAPTPLGKAPELLREDSQEVNEKVEGSDTSRFLRLKQGHGCEHGGGIREPRPRGGFLVMSHPPASLASFSSDRLCAHNERMCCSVGRNQNAEVPRVLGKEVSNGGSLRVVARLG